MAAANPQSPRHPFFRSLLDLVARHGAFDLAITAKGDLDVDQHHTVEDVGITLGRSGATRAGLKKGILRAGYFLMPMDETLAAAAIDLSGRPHWAVSLGRRGVNFFFFFSR